MEGEEIYGLDEGTRTRSKSAKNPECWTNFPLLVKTLKLIINELSDVMEAKATRQAALQSEAKMAPVTCARNGRRTTTRRTA